MLLCLMEKINSLLSFNLPVMLHGIYIYIYIYIYIVFLKVTYVQDISFIVFINAPMPVLVVFILQ